MNLINFFLIITVILLSMYTVLPLLSMHIKFALPSGKKPIPDTKEISGKIQFPSPSDYTIIADENVFHPNRKIPPEKKAEPAPLPKPEVILYGTVIADNVSLAYLEDLKAPRNTPGRGKRQITMKTGDILSGFTLKEIEADKIVMVRGEEKMIVYVKNTQRSNKGRASSSVAPKSSRPQNPSSPVTQPKETGAIMPPSSRMDSEIREFFEKSRDKKK